MIENTDVVVSWLEGLAARGVTVTVTNGRLRIHPSKAYNALTDQELLTLRRHRQAIKDVVRAGIVLHVASASADVTPPSTVEPAPPVPEPECEFCYRAPCIGTDHPDFLLLHPIEAAKAEAEYQTRVMLKMIGRPSPLL